jgi:hypothetical protein
LPPSAGWLAVAPEVRSRKGMRCTWSFPVKVV